MLNIEQAKKNNLIFMLLYIDFEKMNADE